jgi:hypothetical protein
VTACSEGTACAQWEKGFHGAAVALAEADGEAMALTACGAGALCAVQGRYRCCRGQNESRYASMQHGRFCVFPSSQVTPAPVASSYILCMLIGASLPIGVVVLYILGAVLYPWSAKHDAPRCAMEMVFVVCACIFYLLSFWPCLYRQYVCNESLPTGEPGFRPSLDSNLVGPRTMVHGHEAKPKQRVWHYHRGYRLRGFTHRNWHVHRGLCAYISLLLAGPTLRIGCGTSRWQRRQK